MMFLVGYCSVVLMGFHTWIRILDTQDGNFNTKCRIEITEVSIPIYRSLWNSSAGVPSLAKFRL